MKKRELQDVCDRYDISYGSMETKAVLIEKIKLVNVNFVAVMTQGNRKSIIDFVFSDSRAKAHSSFYYFIVTPDQEICIANEDANKEVEVSISDEELLWEMKKPDLQDLCIKFDITFKQNDTKKKLIHKLVNNT
mmetsp:Transcript_15458/g.23485  ORF Transcript_15458/g.23485 Transcript_15458/m.23485 type:complete len:134 (-) Transcript_15458:1263-1664(-)